MILIEKTAVKVPRPVIEAHKRMAQLSLAGLAGAGLGYAAGRVHDSKRKKKSKRLIEKIAQEPSATAKARRAAVGILTRGVEGLFVGEVLGRSRKAALLGAALGSVTGALDEFFRRRAEEHRKKTQEQWAASPKEPEDQAPIPFDYAATRRRR